VNTVTKSRARWADTAIDLSTNLEEAAKHLTVGQLADATGLSQRTIEDSLTREKITAEDNPRGAIDRPKFMIGGMPLWSQAQVADYAMRKARQEQRLAELPLVSPEAAQMRGLISTSEVAKMIGRHDQTVRRWEANFGDYPPAVARRSRNKRPGVPEHVRELEKILDWLRAENARREDEGREPLAVLPDELPAAPVAS
jgi:hypothetical protein